MDEGERRKASSSPRVGGPYTHSSLTFLTYDAVCRHTILFAGKTLLYWYQVCSNMVSIIYDIANLFVVVPGMK